MAKLKSAKETHVRERLGTPTDLKAGRRRMSPPHSMGLLADVFALYMKTKNFHWHMSGPHFRDYHLLLDEQADQIFAMTDDIAERARKIGGTTLRSIGDIAGISACSTTTTNSSLRGHAGRALRRQSAADDVCASAHDVCDEHGDVATASLIENWIDETERRTWFLFEATRNGRPGGERLSVSATWLRSGDAQ